MSLNAVSAQVYALEMRQSRYLFWQESPQTLVVEAESIDDPFAFCLIKLAVSSTPWMLLRDTWVTIPPKSTGEC